MLKHLFRSIILITVICVVVIIQFGCRENVLINSKVSPSSNTINLTSVSLACITHTYYSDSTVTSTNIGGIPIYEAVGNITDPFFGTMTGSTFFQVIPSLASSDTFSGNTVDSAVLVLPYGGFAYGDTALGTGGNMTQTYQVFYMADTMSLANTYYNNSVKPVDQAYPLSAPTTVNVYHLKDSLGINTTDNGYPGLRVRLNWPVLKSHLYPAMMAITATSVNPYQDFMNAFNGICVRPADNRKMGNVIPYFQLDGQTTFSQAGIIVYYHPTGTVVDSDSYQSFGFNSSYCGHFNAVSKSFNHAPVNALLHSTQANDSIIALQNQPGASIDVYVPGINSLPAGVIINKAELQLTLLPGYNSAYAANDSLFPPERLYPTGIASAVYPPGAGLGVAYNVADRYPVYSTTPLVVMDGYVHSLPLGAPTRETFTIDIPREVMYSLSLKNDKIHLQINGTQDFYGAFHMVAGGGSYPDSNYRAKLIVTYSKLTY